MDRKKHIVEILTEYVNTDKYKWEAPVIRKNYCIDCIEALEKQIPKEPIIKTIDVVGILVGIPLKHNYFCPRCKVSINNLIGSPYHYCNKCGQAIDKSKLAEQLKEHNEL